MTPAPELPTKIAIAGPGRSGTSLLVKILSAAGLSTPGTETEYEEVNAGRESRIGINSPFEVDKDPWLFAYAARLSDQQWGEYRALIVPIRNLTEASISRSKNERVFRLVENPELDHWKWDAWGRVPGGALSSTTVSDIREVLSAGLWTLLEVATTKKIPIVLLHFPAFARDADYLWTQLSPHLPTRVTRDILLDAWKATVRPALAREYTTTVGGPNAGELNAMVEDLAGRIAILKRKNAESTMGLRERDRQVGELEKILAETRAELERATSTGEIAASLFEVVERSARGISEMDRRLEHLFEVVERTSQPFPRRVARFLRNRFSRGT